MGTKLATVYELSDNNHEDDDPARLVPEEEGGRKEREAIRGEEKKGTLVGQAIVDSTKPRENSERCHVRDQQSELTNYAQRHQRGCDRERGRKTNVAESRAPICTHTHTHTERGV